MCLAVASKAVVSLVESDKDADICADLQQDCSTEPSLSYESAQGNVNLCSCSDLLYVVNQFLAM